MSDILWYTTNSSTNLSQVKRIWKKKVDLAIKKSLDKSIRSAIKDQNKNKNKKIKCDKFSDSRSRKSPKESATCYPSGYVKKGVDGYYVTRKSGLSNRWVKITPKLWRDTIIYDANPLSFGNGKGTFRLYTKDSFTSIKHIKNFIEDTNS